jgi:hypothetical protein
MVGSSYYPWRLQKTAFNPGLLGLSRLEFEQWLKLRHIDNHAYDVEDLQQDLKTLEQLEAGGLMPRP